MEQVTHVIAGTRRPRRTGRRSSRSTRGPGRRGHRSRGAARPDVAARHWTRRVRRPTKGPGRLAAVTPSGPRCCTGSPTRCATTPTPSPSATPATWVNRSPRAVPRRGARPARSGPRPTTRRSAPRRRTRWPVTTSTPGTSRPAWSPSCRPGTCRSRSPCTEWRRRWPGERGRAQARGAESGVRPEPLALLATEAGAARRRPQRGAGLRRPVGRRAAGVLAPGGPGGVHRRVRDRCRGHRRGRREPRAGQRRVRRQGRRTRVRGRGAGRGRRATAPAASSPTAVRCATRPAGSTCSARCTRSSSPGSWRRRRSSRSATRWTRPSTSVRWPARSTSARCAAISTRYRPTAAPW